MVMRGTVLVLVCVAAVWAGRNRYQVGDHVEVYGNKVGPRANPSESYSWDTLPLCQLEQVHYERRGLGEVLRGDKKAHTVFDFPFRENIPSKELCQIKLTTANVKRLNKFVDMSYAFELLIDGLPVAGRVGKPAMQSETGHHKALLFNHFDFEIAYNGDSIISATLHQREMTASRLPSLKEAYSQEGSIIPVFTSVTWVQSDIEYSHRMDEYVKTHKASHFVEIHWLSIMNSFVLVMLLTAFLSLILMRSVKNDFYAIASANDEEKNGSEEDETGWKLLSQDVFRSPSYLNLFCGMLGAGCQLLLMIVCVLALCLIGTFQPSRRGAFYVAFLIAYALTAGVGGYVSCLYYVRLGGEAWVWNIVTTTLIFAGPFTLVAGTLNAVSLGYGSSSTIPITTVILLLLIWALVTFPLTVLGGISGKHKAETSPFRFPITPRVRPRQLPVSLPWFSTAPFQVLFAGFLPFSAIYMELFYIFTSVWGFKLYTLYGMLTLAVALLLIVTSMITIALVYFQLTAEDYRWWWRSYFCGGAIGFFVYMYSFYYFQFRSEMFGFLQIAFFFGYSFLLSYAVFLALGALGFFCAFCFVQYIYARAKVA